MKWLKKENKDSFEPGYLYVVSAGTYGGDYLVLMEKNNKDCTFLVLPDLQKRVIDREVFQRGIDNKIVLFIEKLPKFAFKDCKKQFDSINI